MRLPPAITLVLLLPAAAAMAADDVLPPPTGRPPSQVILEMGWATPYGDLGDDFFTSELGFGATDGMQAGFRWRWYASEHFSLAPAFHFSDWGNLSGTSEDLGDYRVECYTYAYTLEAMLRTSDRNAALRPFLGLAVGLYRDRVVGYTKSFTVSFDESVNTLGWALRAGFAVSELEFSVVYNLNRFSTWQFFDTGIDQPYDWDNLVIRGAWSIPFGP